MGNFESLRIDFGIEDSVREGERAAEATERVYKFCESKLIEKIDGLEREIKAATS